MRAESLCQEVDISGGQGDVIEIGTLRVDGGPANADCSRYTETGPGVLYVYGSGTVINVRNRMQFGNCSYVTVSGDVIFNAPGKGPAIRVGRQVYPGAILAPDRTLIVGGASNDTYTNVHPWVGKLVTTGLTVMDNQQFLCDQ